MKNSLLLEQTTVAVLNPCVIIQTLLFERGISSRVCVSSDVMLLITD